MTDDRLTGDKPSLFRPQGRALLNVGGALACGVVCVIANHQKQLTTAVFSYAGAALFVCFLTFPLLVGTNRMKGARQGVGPIGDDKRPGVARMICLVCRQEIKGPSPLMTGCAVIVLTYCHDQPTGTGFAHPACTSGETILDLTGKPNYSDYEEDSALPPYFDEVIRREAAKIATRKQSEQ